MPLPFASSKRSQPLNKIKTWFWICTYTMWFTQICKPFKTFKIKCFVTVKKTIIYHGVLVSAHSNRKNFWLEQINPCWASHRSDVLRSLFTPFGENFFWLRNRFISGIRINFEILNHITHYESPDLTQLLVMQHNFAIASDIIWHFKRNSRLFDHWFKNAMQWNGKIVIETTCRIAENMTHILDTRYVLLR